jgi:hypothetical protein
MIITLDLISKYNTELKKLILALKILDIYYIVLNVFIERPQKTHLQDKLKNALNAIRK